MALEDIVNLSITAATNTPTRPGFGVPLLAVSKYPSAFLNRTYSFTSLKGMTDFGFVTTDAAYLMAANVFAQNPRVKRLKVGKRVNKTTQIVTLTLAASSTVGDVYSINVAGTDCSGDIDATEDQDDAATKLATAIDALAGITASATTNVVTVTAGTAGVVFNCQDWSSNIQLTTRNTTMTDGNLSADLAAIASYDNDWYGLCLDSSTKKEALEAATWCESNDKIGVFDTSDYECIDGSSTTNNVMHVMKANNIARSGCIFNANKLLNYAAPAWLGNRFPYDPGTDTWMFKTLKNVTVSVLTDSQAQAVLDKNGNIYTSISGLSITQNGKTAFGEYFDVVRFIDWLKAEIKVRIFAVLANSQKIPYTDQGVEVIVSIIKAVLQDGVNVGGLAADPAFVVSAPLVADIDSVTKGTRTLPDVTFSATLQGAIHAIEINGTVSV